MAKSFGSFSIPWAEKAHVPEIWLTPILTDALIRKTLRETLKADLLIGGSEDRLWATDGLLETPGTYVQIEDADHSLQIAQDWRASLAAHAQAFTLIEQFVTNSPQLS